MRKGRFSEEQIINVLKEHQAGMPVAELCRKHGISDATFYTWRSKYGGMEIFDACKLKALEDENRKLKKLLAEAMLDVARLQGAIAGERQRSRKGQLQLISSALRAAACCNRKRSTSTQSSAGSPISCGERWVMRLPWNSARLRSFGFLIPTPFSSRQLFSISRSTRATRCPRAAR